MTTHTGTTYVVRDAAGDQTEHESLAHAEDHAHVLALLGPVELLKMTVIAVYKHRNRSEK